MSSSVLKLAKIKEIKVGDILEVDVDDPKADNDIEQLVKNINIKLLNKIKKKAITFYIEKNKRMKNLKFQILKK